MKKCLLFILPLLVYAEIYAQSRIPIKPIELRNREILATANGPEGFYIAHKIESKDSIVRIGIRVWNGIYWANFTHIELDTPAIINTMIFDKKGQLHLGGSFVYKKGPVKFKNVIYFNNSDWHGYPSSEHFKPGQVINDFAFLNDSLAMFGKFDSIQTKAFNTMLTVN